MTLASFFVLLMLESAFGFHIHTTTYHLYPSNRHISCMAIAKLTSTVSHGWSLWTFCSFLEVYLFYELFYLLWNTLLHCVRRDLLILARSLWKRLCNFNLKCRQSLSIIISGHQMTQDRHEWYFEDAYALSMIVISCSAPKSENGCPVLHIFTVKCDLYMFFWLYRGMRMRWSPNME